MTTPDYVLTEEVQIKRSYSEPITLPAGAFVRPIELKWVPKHVLDDPDWTWVKEGARFCYTRIGIVPIPAKAIRRV